MRFSDRVAVVTGGARGLGRAYSIAFASEGASVAVLDLDHKESEETVSLVEKAGTAGIALRCNVADETEVADAVEGVLERFGRIDVLVNNAALHLDYYSQPFGALPSSDVRELFDVNVFGVVNCALACRSAMKTQAGAAVVNISSTASFHNKTAYGVSKLAVRGITVALATEFAPDGIRVNGIAPGMTATEEALAKTRPEVIDNVMSLQLVKRLGAEDDMVAATLFLSSDEAGFITGETLRVTGGYPLFI